LVHVVNDGVRMDDEIMWLMIRTAAATEMELVVVIKLLFMFK